MDEPVRRRLHTLLGVRVPPGADSDETKVSRVVLLETYVAGGLLDRVAPWLTRPEVSPSTLRIYADDLIVLGLWCRQRLGSKLSVQVFDAAAEQRWAAEQLEQRVSEGSVNRRLTTWHGVVKRVGPAADRP